MESETSANLPYVVIGPHFVQTSPPQNPIPELESLGVSLEMATATFSFCTHLYAKANRFHTPISELRHIMVLAEDLPFEVDYLPLFSIRTPIGLFIPLESLLVGIYQSFRVARNIFSVLTDLRDMVDFAGTWFEKRKALIPAADKLGFQVISAVCFGQSLLVDIGWLPPQDRGCSKCKLVIMCAQVDFRPRPDGTLGIGKWYTPRAGSTQVLLHFELRRVAPRNPSDLCSEAGKQELLNLFQWTPLARMTKTEARTARLQFIKDHPLLISDFEKLAEALKEAGLYSENTNLWQIRKFIPSLLSELEKKQS